MFLDERRTRGNRMVKVPVMEVINMAGMFDRNVAAVSAMLMTVVGVGARCAHKILGRVALRNTENGCAEDSLRNQSMLGPSRECQQLTKTEKTEGFFTEGNEG
jgi:hypothetical protein